MVKKYPLFTNTHTHSVIQTQPHIRHHKYRFIRYVHIGDDEQIFVGFWQIKALHLARFRKLVCKMNKTIWIFLYAIPQKKKHIITVKLDCEHSQQSQTVTLKTRQDQKKFLFPVTKKARLVGWFNIFYLQISLSKGKERETDRQTDRQTDRDRERDRETERERERERETDRQTDRQREKDN